MVGKVRAYKNQRRIPGIKIQSAMEYLSTYGWAILIIAIVLGALYSLGVFSTNNQPRQVAGACQVLRPDGPGTLNHISLSGPCNAGIPQYVVETQGPFASGCAAEPLFLNVNGIGSEFPSGSTNSITISSWYNVFASTGTTDTIFHIRALTPAPGGTGVSCNTQGCNFPDTELYNPLPQQCNYGVCPDSNIWHFVAITLSNSGTAKMYLDGAEMSSMYVDSGTWSTVLQGIYNLEIGSWNSGCGDPFNGMISNVQVYNTALSQNGIKALYQEGISGAPINLRNLVGWWPLNGDTNDYSGNGNNGVPGNIIYVSQYSYTPP